MLFFLLKRDVNQIFKNLVFFSFNYNNYCFTLCLFTACCNPKKTFVMKLLMNMFIQYTTSLISLNYTSYCWYSSTPKLLPLLRSVLILLQNHLPAFVERNNLTSVEVEARTCCVVNQSRDGGRCKPQLVVLQCECIIVWKSCDVFVQKSLPDYCCSFCLPLMPLEQNGSRITRPRLGSDCVSLHSSDTHLFRKYSGSQQSRPQLKCQILFNIKIMPEITGLNVYVMQMLVQFIRKTKTFSVFLPCKMLVKGHLSSMVLFRQI